MDTSRLRQQLIRVGGEIARQIQVLAGRPPMIRGNVYRLRRRCGKSGCRCMRGELHESWVLLARERGVRRMRAVPRGQADRWRELAENYRRFRRARRELARLHREAMRLAGLLEEGRAIAPVPEGGSTGGDHAGSDPV